MFKHISWAIIPAIFLAALWYFQPEDTLFSLAIDPLRVLWKLTLVLMAAWLAYQLARSLLPDYLAIPNLLKIVQTCHQDEKLVYTLLLCAVVFSRLMFMGLISIAIAFGG